MTTVLYEIKNGIGRITLNRPAQFNAFNEEMHLELRRVLSDAKDNPKVRAIMLTGAGKGFCAGQDLNERAPGAEARDLGETIKNFYNPLIRQMEALEKPKLAVVNGAAAGAGIGVALACDIVLAADTAKFAIAFGKIGLIPDAGLTWRLVQLLGLARAKAFVLTQGVWSAEQARDYGLVWEIHEASVLQERAQALATRLAYGAATGTALSIRALNAATNNTLDEQLLLEMECQREAGFSTEYREGVTAFLEKREAVFFQQEID